MYNTALHCNKCTFLAKWNNVVTRILTFLRELLGIKFLESLY